VDGKRRRFRPCITPKLIVRRFAAHTEGMTAKRVASRASVLVVGTALLWLGWSAAAQTATVRGTAGPNVLRGTKHADTIYGGAEVLAKRVKAITGGKFDIQVFAAGEIADQIADGNKAIVGVMLESFLVGGRQDLVPGEKLTYGQSITDACIDWDTTVLTLDRLSSAVRERRKA